MRASGIESVECSTLPPERGNATVLWNSEREPDEINHEAMSQANTEANRAPDICESALMTFEQLSIHLSMGRTQIYRLISRGQMPAPIKFGKSSRWSRAQVDAWIAEIANTTGRV